GTGATVQPATGGSLSPEASSAPASGSGGASGFQLPAIIAAIILAIVILLVVLVVLRQRRAPGQDRE
ncbi:MAG TPA: hypothetical protein VIM30_11250, partial [Candidatus Limnocylindrales bacterium]